MIIFPCKIVKTHPQFSIYRGSENTLVSQFGPREKFSFQPGCPLFHHHFMDAKTATAKAGLEESSQSLLHRIRITLSSTKTKALEQGNYLSLLSFHCLISSFIIHYILRSILLNYYYFNYYDYYVNI